GEVGSQKARSSQSLACRRHPDRQLFGVGAVTERQKDSWPSAISLHVRRRGIVRVVFGNRLSVLRIRSIAFQRDLSGQDHQSYPAFSAGYRSWAGVGRENFAGRLERGIENSP